MHLHSLGIFHRDLRAGNVLIDSMDPLHVVVADFGVSHRLKAFAEGRQGAMTASRFSTVLRHGAALGPLQVACWPAPLLPSRDSTQVAASRCYPPFFSCAPLQPFAVVQWTAPEVRAGNEAEGRVATAASDVYMLGGLIFELLTAGTVPFHWLSGNPQLLVQRLCSADPVAMPDCDAYIPGLLATNVLEAYSMRRESTPVQWRVRTTATPGSADRLEELKSLMADCLSFEPEHRPKLVALLRRVAALLDAETTSA
jgi:serine/threonine protein kinase